MMDRRIFSLGVCPDCGSAMVKVTRTLKPERHLVCKVCQHRWKTIELILPPEGFDRQIIAGLIARKDIDLTKLAALIHVAMTGYK